VGYWGVAGATGEPLLLGDNGRPGIAKIRNGKPSYEKCSDSARYYETEIGVQNYNANTMFCVRTLLGRYGAVRMTKDWKSEKYIDLTIVIWEPKT
jgi:hypothetical protein